MMPRLLRWLPLSVCIACASSHVAPGSSAPVAASADAPNPRAVQPERPTVATHAGTVAPGYLEVETGVEADRFNAHTRGVQIPTVFKFGVAPRVQFAVQVPLTSSTGIPFGAGDVAAGIKLRLFNDRPLLRDFAILPQVKFSTGGARGAGTTDASLLLISSRTMGGASVDLNAGVTRRSGDGSEAPRTSTVWTASAGIPLRGAWGSALELYGYPGTSGAAGQRPIVALLAGPTYQVRADLVLDVGVILPIAGAQPRALYAGLVTNVGRFWPR